MKNLLTLVGIVLLCNSLLATTYTFTATSGEWNNVANWDNYPGGSISSSDDVIINGICTIPSDLSIQNNGTITISEGAELSTISGGPIFLNSTNGTINIVGKLITNSNFYNQGILTNDGELESNHVLINFNTFINNGKATIQGNQFSNVGLFTNNDEFIALTHMSNQENFNQLGVYRGTDAFDLDAFTNEGTMAPGAAANTIGELTFNTDYIELGTYQVDIAGDTGAGQEGGNDLLDINLGTTLTGTLQIQLLGGYIPEIGDEFTILTSSNSINGTYSSIDYPSLPSGRSWEIDYNTLDVRVRVIVGNTSPNVATYYVSNSIGNDTNDGLSPSTPWQSISKIASLTYETGDSVLLKKGDSWIGVSQYFNRSFVYIGAYGSGPFPKITNVQELPNVNIASNWTSVNSIWECDLSASTTRLFLDDTEVLRGSLLSEVGVTDSEGYIPKWFHTNGKIYIDHPTNPASTWNSIKGSQNYITFNVENSNQVTIEEIAFEGGTGPSLQLAGANNIIIQNCELGKHASSGLLLVNGSNNCTINNNIVNSHYAQMHGIGNGTDRGCRDGIRLANDASNNIIENNTLTNWSHNGIELLNTFVTSNGVNNNIIRYNHISAPDIPYAHPIGADGPSGRCTGNDIGYNYITDCRTTCQINGEYNRFHHNILKNFQRSPAKASFSAHAITIAAYDVLGIGNISRNNIFENNLIINTDEAAFRFDDQGFNILVDSIYIRNNIIIDSGLDPINGAYNTGTAIYFDDTEYMNDIFFENNLFYQTAVLGDVLHKVISNEYLDISTFNLLEEIDGIKSLNNQKSDPLLDINDEPLDASPAVNSGRNTDQLILELDYNSNNIQGGMIDIGPFENQNSCGNRSIIMVNQMAQGSNDGTSWRNGYLTLVDAFLACPTSIDKEFWVAEGLYYPTAGLDQTIALSIPNDSKLFGGFRGAEINRNQRNYAMNETVLSGNIGLENINTDNSHQIIDQTNGSNIVIDGVIIENANSTLNRSAIHLNNSTIEIRNTIIKENTSNQYPVINCIQCNLTLDQVVAINNTTTSAGVIYTDANGTLTLKDSEIEGQVDIHGILDLISHCIFK